MPPKGRGIGITSQCSTNNPWSTWLTLYQFLCIEQLSTKGHMEFWRVALHVCSSCLFCKTFQFWCHHSNITQTPQVKGFSPLQDCPHCRSRSQIGSQVTCISDQWATNMRASDDHPQIWYSLEWLRDSEKCYSHNTVVS